MGVYILKIEIMLKIEFSFSVSIPSYTNYKIVIASYIYIISAVFCLLNSFLFYGFEKK